MALMSKPCNIALLGLLDNERLFFTNLKTFNSFQCHSGSLKNPLDFQMSPFGQDAFDHGPIVLKKKYTEERNIMDCLSALMCAQAKFCLFSALRPKRDYSP